MPLLDSTAWGTGYTTESTPSTKKAESTYLEGLKATWEQESIWQPSLVRPTLEYPMDSHFDYKSYDKEYWPYVAVARNKDHADDLVKQYQREKQNREIRENQNWALGLTQDLLVGLTNPLNYIGGAGKTVLQTAGRTALGAGVGTALTEPILQGRQVSRTTGESLMNVGSSVVLGGAFGAGVHAAGNKLQRGGWTINDSSDLPMPELPQLSQEMNQAFGAQSIGAAQASPLSADGTKIAGIGWLPEKVADPLTRFALYGDFSRSANQRLMTSNFAASRSFAETVMRNSLATLDNVEGIAKQVPLEIRINQRISETATKLVAEDHSLRDAWWNKVESGAYDKADIESKLKELYPSLGQNFQLNRTSFDMLAKAEMAGVGDFGKTMDEVGHRAALAKKVFEQLDKEKIDNNLMKKEHLYDLQTGKPLQDPSIPHEVHLAELRKMREEVQAEINALNEVKKTRKLTPDEVAQQKALKAKLAGNEQAIEATKLNFEEAKKAWDAIYPDSSVHGLYSRDGNYYLSRVFDKGRIIADPARFRNDLIQGWLARNPELDAADQAVMRELQNAAEKVKNTLLQEENVNTLGEIKIHLARDLDAAANFTKDRTLNIDDSFLLDWTHHSLTDTQLYHLSQAAVDVEMAKLGFNFNEAKYALEREVSRRVDEINAEFGAGSNKALKEINEVRSEYMKDLAEMEYAMRALKRQGPEGKSPYSSKILTDNIARVNRISGMAMLGSSAIPNSLGDIASIGNHLGIARTYKIMAKALFDSDFRKLMSKNAKEIGVLAELVNKSMRDAHMADMYSESLNPNKGFRSAGWTKFDNMLNWVSDKYATISFIDPWSKVGRTVASAAANENIVTAALKGWDNLSARDRLELTKFYIDESSLKRFADQIRAHSTEVDGLKFAEPDSWADQDAARLFKQSAYAMTEYSLNIPSIGSGSEFISQTVAGKLFMRFKSFNNASHESTFLASLQNREVARMATSTMNWLFWGFLSTYAYDVFKGNPHSMDDYFGSPEKIQKTFWKSLTKSGYIAAASDAAVNVTKLVGATPGEVGRTMKEFVPAGIEDEIFPKFKDVSALEKLAGPTWSYMSKAGSAGLGLLNTDDGLSDKDIRSIRSLSPINNIFWLRRGLDHIEESLGGYPVK